MNKEAKWISKLAQMKSKENQITKHTEDKLRGIGIFFFTKKKYLEIPIQEKSKRWQRRESQK